MEVYYGSEKGPIHWLNKEKAFVASVDSLNTSYVGSIKSGFMLASGESNKAGMWSLSSKCPWLPFLGRQ